MSLVIVFYGPLMIGLMVVDVFPPGEYGFTYRELILFPVLQIRAGQWSITTNLWPLTAHIYHVMIIMTVGFSKKLFLLFILLSFLIIIIFILFFIIIC